MQNSPAPTPVVIVEGSPQLASVLATVLDTNQYPVTQLSCARDCLQSLPGQNGVTYLVDLLLEDMDGLLIEELRMQQPQASVVAFLSQPTGKTGSADSNMEDMLEEQSLRKLTERSGADALFVAPFNLGEIVCTIERLAALTSAEAVA